MIFNIDDVERVMRADNNLTGGEMGPKLTSLVELAQSGKDEDWAKIDEMIREGEDGDMQQWSDANLGNKSSNLRDLAASILEQTKTYYSDETIHNLQTLMREKDENPYPAFRAACALASRFLPEKTSSYGDERVEPLKQEIIDKLKEYQEDPAVSDIVKKYLQELEG